MKKALLALLSAVLVLTAIQPVQAQDQKVLAIIDTAINSNNFPQIIYEACFTTEKVPANPVLCPNGTKEMEGKGSAAATPWATSINNGVYHGDSMVKSALAVNPNTKIVFIRISNTDSTGATNAFSNQLNSLISAIDWVSKNASKHSIDAVSISQSTVTSTGLSSCSTDTRTISAVASLVANNIPVFAATGNNGRTDVVGFPACVNGVVGVGALFSTSTLEKATNRGPGLDLVAMGKITVTKYNGSTVDLAGTSGATAVSASSYVNKSTYPTFQEYVNSLPKLLVSGASYSYVSR
jgi:hypothetical protein